MTFPSDDITTKNVKFNEKGELIKVEPVFEMTREEVKYFLNNSLHEYLAKDTYYEAMNLIKRMREFLDKQ